MSGADFLQLRKFAVTLSLGLRKLGFDEHVRTRIAAPLLWDWFCYWVHPLGPHVSAIRIYCPALIKFCLRFGQYVQSESFRLFLQPEGVFPNVSLWDLVPPKQEEYARNLFSVRKGSL
jgi:hypothetical protein